MLNLVNFKTYYILFIYLGGGVHMSAPVRVRRAKLVEMGFPYHYGSQGTNSCPWAAEAFTH